MSLRVPLLLLVPIKDDYLITPTGTEWLSRAPREIGEIESEMAQRGR